MVASGADDQLPPVFIALLGEVFEVPVIAADRTAPVRVSGLLHANEGWQARRAEVPISPARLVGLGDGRV
jgi:hypothetical protein